MSCPAPRLAARALVAAALALAGCGSATDDGVASNEGQREAGAADASLDGVAAADAPVDGADAEDDGPDGGAICTPGAVQALATCGKCGTGRRICGADGVWGAPICEGETGECVASTIEREACGACGSHDRVCDATCKWGAFSACVGEGACTPGQTDTQSCGSTCSVKTRTCDATCTWSAFSACTTAGECSPGQTRDCMCSTLGGFTSCCGVETCDAGCHWGGCGLRPGAECDWNGGVHYRCCAASSWQYCLSSCTWSSACAACSGCGC